MSDLENSYLFYLNKDMSLLSSLNRLKKAGLVKKAGK